MVLWAWLYIYNYICTSQVISPPLQRGHYPFFTFSDDRESSVVAPPSSTFTISMRRQSDTMDFDSGNPGNSDDEFVVIECTKSKSPDLSSDMVVVGSCEPNATTSRDPSVQSDPAVVDSETIPTEYSLNSLPH